MADKRQPPQNVQSVENEDSSSSSSEGQSDSGSNSNSLNAFVNDGGFLERFKQMQEACKQQAASQEAQFAVPQSDSAATVSVKTEPTEPDAAAAAAAAAARKRTLPFVGKRRGGKVLKTGIVHKPKVEDEEELPKDAWSRYLAEVRKYRERSCDDEEKTRPLVK
ncbi:telomerase RNA component interacting RNase-like [Dermacentor silvarum]|uniref:telomerase RNA component interacting RNase-like n=1 Tax=Dermacentor silvarum TaxID=543639 RepID=UPI00189A1D70|nr:telomerase RNA component interacting RNase-like [Dermacentor silvarum]